MSTRLIHEIGVDYEGVSKRHLQVNEEVTFINDKASRIIMPECGSFYVDSLIVRDIATGEVLARVKDYDVFISDAKATLASGKEVCGTIIVNNPNVRGILLEYQYVGGLHMTGYYLLEQLIKMYPNGSNAIISFDDILQVPELMDPAYHTQHVGEFYKTDSLLVWLERVRQGIHKRQDQQLVKMYETAQSRIDGLYTKLNESHDRLTQDVTEILKSISIQSDEYILTDSAENPAIRRKYGNWQLVTNTILKGGPNSFLVGSGSIIAMGNDQIIRNCYIWKNIEDSTTEDITLSISADKTTINEGDKITFSILSNNIPTGTKLAWVVEGGDSLDFTGALSGTATVTSGKATVTLTSVKDRRTDGDKGYIFRLKDYPNVKQEFVILDTSVDRRITALSFLDLNNKPVDTVTEDQRFKLRIVTNDMIGQTVYLKWSTDSSALHVAPPTSVVITSNTQDIALETVGNLTANPVRDVQVYALEDAKEVVDATTPSARVLILDTSTELTGNLYFLNAQGLITDSIDEDRDFKINLKTNGGVGSTVKFSYRSNKALTEFEGLSASAVIQAGNEITINAKNKADYITAHEQEFLEVTAINAQTDAVIAKAILLINDTTRNPSFTVVLASDKLGSKPVTLVNEGEDFYLVFKIPGWVEPATPPSLDVITELTGLPNFASRVEGPASLTNLKFASGSQPTRVEWVGTDTLAIRYTAIADKAVYGNATFGFKWKMSNGTSYSDKRELTIVDTSKPNLSASFSSSATELIPITRVDEMKSGLGVKFYLWINVDGVGSTIGDINLALDVTSQAGNADIVDIFPQTIKIAQGANNHVVKVETVADFLNEGDEVLTLIATAAAYPNPLFTSSITIVDNSVQLPLSHTLSTSTWYKDEVAKYSEWESVEVTVNLTPVDFPTTLEVAASGVTKWVTGLPTAPITIAANQSSYVIKLNPTTERRDIGNYELSLAIDRKYANKVISPRTTAKLFYYNDRGNPTIESFKIINDDGSNIEATQLEEGKKYGLVVSVNNPASGMAVVFANTNGNMADVGTSAGWGRFDLARRLVSFKLDERRGLVETTPLVFEVFNDRKTNPVGLKFDASVVIDWSTIGQALKVGDSYTSDVTTESAGKKVKLKSLPITDTSKTMTYSYSYSKTEKGAAVNVFDEGDDVFIRIQLKDATIGDVYTLNNSGSSGVALSRYSYHEFGVKEVTITESNQLLVFKATLLKNYITDSDQVAYLNLNNKTATSVDSLANGYTVLDTTKTGAMTAQWVLDDGKDTLTNSVDEGVAVKLKVTTNNLVVGSKVKLINITGRAKTEFDVYTDGGTAGIEINAQGIVYFPFTPSKNYKVDGLTTLTATAQVVDQVAVKQTSPTLNINDSTTKPEYQIYWQSAQGAQIQQANEGDAVKLVVKTWGVATGSDVSVTLSGTGITKDDFVDDTLTKSGKLAVDSSGLRAAFINFDWTIKNDLITEGNEVATASVTINGSLVKTVPLTIVDTSLTPPVFEAYFSSTANGDTKVTEIKRGESVYLILESKNLVQATSCAWTMKGDASTVISGVTYNTFDLIQGNINATNGKVALTLTAKQNIEVSGVKEVSITVTVPSSVGYVNTPSLTVRAEPRYYLGMFDAAKEYGPDALIDISSYTGVTPATLGIRAFINEYKIPAANYKYSFRINGSTFELTQDTIGTYERQLTVAANVNNQIHASLINGTNKLELLENNVVVHQININGIGKTPTINSVYFASDKEGLRPISEANPGDNAYLIAKTTDILDGNKLSISFPVKDALEQKNFLEGSIEGTQLIDVGQFKAATGEGHTWYKLRVRPTTRINPNSTITGVYSAETGLKISKVAASVPTLIKLEYDFMKKGDKIYLEYEGSTNVKNWTIAVGSVDGGKASGLAAVFDNAVDANGVIIWKVTFNSIVAGDIGLVFKTELGEILHRIPLTLI